jgi:glycosyltransferase involved in cell wall biosynthesis
MISYLDYPSYTGLSRRIEGLSKVLRSNGIDVEIVCPRFRHIGATQGQADVVAFDLRMLRGADPSKTFPKLLCLCLFTALALKYIIRRRRELAVVQYESIYSSLPAILAKVLTKAYTVGDDVVIRERTDSPFVNAATHVLEAILLRLTDTLITSSPKTLKLFRKLNVHRYMYVPNGVKVPAPTPPHQTIQRGDKCVALFVGAPSYAENRTAVEQLVRLPREMPHHMERLRIWIVGGPLTDLKHMLDDQLVESGIVKFWGSVNEKTLDAIYGSSRVGLLPFFSSGHDAGGQRMKALEYLAHGLVVISTSAGVRGLPDLVGGAHFIHVSSIQEMTEVLKGIIESPEEYQDIAVRGKVYVTTRHSWEVITREYVGFIRAILERLHQ